MTIRTAAIKTHRGFTVPLGGGSDNGYAELPLVDVLYERIRTTVDFVDDFDFLSDVITAARKVLFGQHGFVLYRQVSKPASRWVHSFSLSTLQLINGQQRRISLENYRDLLVFHPKGVEEIDHLKAYRESNLTWMATATPGDILSKWVKLEGGLTDLVTTLHLVAGSLPENWKDFSEAAV